MSALSPFDEEATRRALNAITAAGGSGEVAAGQVLELLEWIGADPSPEGARMWNLVSVFINVGASMAAMLAGEQNRDRGEVLRDVDQHIATIRAQRG